MIYLCIVLGSWAMGMTITTTVLIKDQLRCLRYAKEHSDWSTDVGRAYYDMARTMALGGRRDQPWP